MSYKPTFICHSCKAGECLHCEKTIPYYEDSPNKKSSIEIAPCSCKHDGLFND